MSFQKSSFLGGFGRLLGWATLILLTTTSCHAFSILATTPAAASSKARVMITTRLSSSTSSSSSNDAANDSTTIESLTVSALPDNHEQVGQELAESIQRWLDAEWMPQDIHLEMGLSAKASYVNCRMSGHDDLMMIMTAIVDDLMEDWHTVYDAAAFVNAWDIGNYASDYLTKKQGIVGCECSARIY